MNWNITAGRPVYVQLVEQLELALVAGEFPPGSRIPPAGTLAAEFLHQMQALGLTEAEIETLLRETAQQAQKKE